MRKRFWYPALEGLRGTAAAWVLLSHVFLLVQCNVPLLGRGDIAVDLFILISGFLMTSHYVERRQQEPWEAAETWRLFWLRRFFRIAPLYYLCLAIAFLLGPFIGEARHAIAQVWPETATPLARSSDRSFLNVLLHVSFMFGLLPYFSFSTPLPDWSISLGAQYYAVFPLLFWLAAKTGFALALLLTCSVMAFAAHASYFEAYIMPAALPLKFLLFAAGMLVAWSRCWCLRRFALMALAMPVIAAYLHPAHVSHGALAAQCLLVVLLYWCASPVLSAGGAFNKLKYLMPWLLSTPVCQWLGRVSYSVYLLHLLVVIPVVAYLTGLPDFVSQQPWIRACLALAAVVPATYGLSYLLYRFIELGGIRLGEAVLARAARISAGDAAPTLAKSWLKTILSTAGLMLATFISGVVSARWLGPEGRGVLSAAQLVMTLASGVSQLGLGAALVYACRIDASFPGRRYFALSMVCIVAIALALAVAGADYGSAIQPSIFLPLLVLTGLTAANAYASAVSQLSPGLSAFNSGRLALAVITLLALLVLVDLEALTVANILWTQLGATLVTLVSMSIVSFRLIRSQQETASGAGRVSAVGYISSGFKFHGTALLSLLLLNIDKLTLYAIGTTKEFGLYSVAYATSRLIGSVQEAMSTALYARFAGKDAARLTEVVQLVFRFSFLPLLLVALLLGYVSPWLLSLVYGNAFAEVALPFAILLLECVIGNASWILAQQFNATGRPGVVLLRQVVAVGPVLLLIFWMPREHIALSLSLVMLLSACVRLGMSMLMFKWVANLPLPRFFPTRTDFILAREKMANLSGFKAG
ncbi:acyltransferase family protein [Methylomonas sp. HW2-6]|uniref:acyltransferase family protein n=1 Tax=Methylomonas sp. HW2-6 TaxID=3376687 RepID=UPI00404314B8